MIIAGKKNRKLKNFALIYNEMIAESWTMKMRRTDEKEKWLERKLRKGLIYILTLLILSFINQNDLSKMRAT